LPPAMCRSGYGLCMARSMIAALSPLPSARRCGPVGLLVLFAFCTLAAAQDATPQQYNAPAQDQPPAAAPSGPAMPTPPEAMGAIGRLLNQSISNIGAGVNAGVKGAGDTLGATTNAAGELAKGVTSGVTDAAGTVARLPLSNVVTGWQRCAVAPNGAPDCNVASVALCRTKGFSGGSSLDITSSRKCPPSVWAQGREPLPGECQDESFVSRAACQ
jgi:hypothetical protein